MTVGCLLFFLLTSHSRRRIFTFELSAASVSISLDSIIFAFSLFCKSFGINGLVIYALAVSTSALGRVSEVADFRIEEGYNVLAMCVQGLYLNDIQSRQIFMKS